MNVPRSKKKATLKKGNTNIVVFKIYTKSCKARAWNVISATYQSHEHCFETLNEGEEINLRKKKKVVESGQRIWGV